MPGMIDQDKNSAGICYLARFTTDIGYDNVTENLHNICIENTFGFTWFKVNSEQEACAKCFAVHIVKFEILETTWKTKQKTSKH